MTLFEFKKLIDKACEVAKSELGEAAKDCGFGMNICITSMDRILVMPKDKASFLVMQDRERWCGCKHWCDCDRTPE